MTSSALTFISIAIVVGTSIWVAVDAHHNKIGSGGVGWFFGCILLWIVVFPTYLFSRAKTLRERGVASSSTPAVSFVGALCIVAVVGCFAAPFLGWERLSDDDLRDQVVASIKEKWSETAATRDLRVKSLTLVRRAGNEYSGILTADNLGREEQYSVDVTYDGKNFMWKLQ